MHRYRKVRSGSLTSRLGRAQAAESLQRIELTPYGAAWLRAPTPAGVRLRTALNYADSYHADGVYALTP